VRGNLSVEDQVDFTAVLREVLPRFEARQVSFALIGGVALGSYGMVRATIDLDFVADASSQDEVIGLVESLGYRTLHRSRGYSNHEHADAERGGIDFVYVRDETSRKVFAATRATEGPGGLRIPVASPEHLIAMKVLAMKNDPSRKFQDMADVRFLWDLPGIDRVDVRAQFEKHGLLESYRELEAS
jgi:hypothetical protein